MALGELMSVRTARGLKSPVTAEREGVLFGSVCLRRMLLFFEQEHLSL